VTLNVGMSCAPGMSVCDAVHATAHRDGGEFWDVVAAVAIARRTFTTYRRRH
jgi:hypothetical protein